MRVQLNQVREFFLAFKIPFKTEPTNVSKDRYLLRYELMEEENQEYLTACKEDNLTEIADALGDKLYILCGTILEHGMQYKINEIFAEINRSNMSKADQDGKPIYREDGKVLKGKNYFKPDFSRIL